MIEDLKQEGVAVIYVSHKMEEIFAIGDVVTVLRDGRKVGTHRAAELDPHQLIKMMVGREVKLTTDKPGVRQDRALLGVHGLGLKGRFRNIQFELHAGEILGIAGLMGAGRTGGPNSESPRCNSAWYWFGQ